MHRNTRRRPHRLFGYYFITTNVSQGFVLLDTAIFGHLLEHTIHLSAYVNECQILAYKINPDHIHLIVQLGTTKTISNFVGSFKRNFSRQTNLIIERNLKSHPKKGDVHISEDLKSRLLCINQFRWQPSYHSHLITSKQDFDNHIKYVLRQYIKHGLDENKFCYVESAHKFKLK